MLDPGHFPPHNRTAMQMTTSTAQIGPFTFLLDRDRPFNRIIHSKVKHFELDSTTLGVSIKFVTKGTETYIINGQKVLVQPGEFLIANHLRDLTIDIHESKAVEGVCLYLDPYRLAALWQSEQQSDQALLDHPYEQNTRPLDFFEAVFSAQRSPLSNILSHLAPFQTFQRSWKEPLIKEAFFHELATRLIQHKQHTERQLKSIPSVKRSTKIELHKRLNLALDFMHQNLDAPIQLSDIAKVAYLSEYHFLRTFKSCFQVTPHQYLLQLRLQRAKELLRQTGLPVRQVAEQAGFTDAQYFNRLFRKRIGLSPRDFRNSKT